MPAPMQAAVYRAHAEQIRSRLRGLLLNAEDAEDLAQDVFLQVFQRWRYCPSRGSLQAFLLTVARSRALDRLRQRSSRRNTQRRFAEQARQQLPRLPDEEAVRSEIGERVRSALLHLPERQRRVLVLAYFDGLTQAQIARQLNLPLGTVKSQCRHGLLKLRKELGMSSPISATEG